MWNVGRYVLLAVGAIALPLVASAQTTYSVSTRSEPYQPIPIAHPQAQPPTTYLPSSVSAPQEITFPVKFFGVNYPTLWASPQGYVMFALDTLWHYNNASLPSTAVPNAIIAAFWDDLDLRGAGAHLKSQILGVAPNRTLVVEWKAGFYFNGTNFADFQIWLQEGGSTIEIHYGSIVSDGWHASMGIEDDTGTIGYEVPMPGGGSCSPSCNHTTWLTDTVVTFAQGPELRTTQVTGPIEAFAGLPVDLSATVYNTGGKPAEEFTMSFYVSKEPTLDVTAIELITLDENRTLLPQETTTFETTVRLPIILEEGSWYIIAEADPHLAVPETNRGDNFATFGPFEIGIRAANLTVDWVATTDLAAPGEEVWVQWSGSNTGNLIAQTVPYRVFFDRSQYPSAGAVELSRGMISSLDIDESQTFDIDATIPIDAAPGVYFLGVEIDPERELFEHERRDNFGHSFPIVISEEGLVVLTEDLPVAQIHGSYEVRLMAVGGNGSHLWTLAEGSSLPPGLRIDGRVGATGEFATFLSGQPGAVGDFPLAFEVESAGMMTTADYVLHISSTEYELRVTTESLAGAAFGFEYHDELSAIGGKPPYTWEVTRENALPHGTFLRSDGVISGRPLEDGTFLIPVRVTDSEGRLATHEFFLNVAPPASLTCVTQELPVLEIGQFFQFSLLAAGGKKGTDGNYLWTQESLIRLAQELGEQSGPVKGDLGLKLDTDGRVHGEPKLFGTFLWTVHVRDDTPGSPGLKCPVLVRIPRDRGLTVVTQQLPAAIAGRAYRAQLEASGGDGELVWSEYGSSRLLEELRLEFDANGNIVGTPSNDALQGETDRDFSITLRVEDEMGRIGVGVVTLSLKEAPSRRIARTVDDGGCQTGGGATGAGLVAFLGLVLLRRRR